MDEFCVDHPREPPAQGCAEGVPEFCGRIEERIGGCHGRIVSVDGRKTGAVCAARVGGGNFLGCPTVPVSVREPLVYPRCATHSPPLAAQRITLFQQILYPWTPQRMTTENPDDETPTEPTEQSEQIEETGQTEQTEEQPPESNPEDPLLAIIEAGRLQSEQSEETGSGTKPEEQLQAIIDIGKTGRLSPADEDRAVELLKQTIAGGPKALAATLDAILSLPWSAGVKAVADAWPETKPAGRARLVAALAKADSDASRRIRLSLARGLHAQDPATALKLISSVCEAMGGAVGGSSTKDRQIFANVMLGKARPWLMNIAMSEMKPAEAQKLITPALESCAQAPIFTQIWVLRWICDANQFDTLPPEHIDSIGKSINRWQARWHKELRKIIPKLPESLEAALSSGPGRPAAQPVAAVTESGDAPAGIQDERDEEDEEDDEDDEDDDDERDEEPGEGSSTGEEGQQPAPPERQPVRARESQQRGGRDRGDRGDRRDRGDRGDRSDRGQQGGPFDLNRSLREIESYVVRLRSELAQAQVAARRREPSQERNRGRSQAAPGSIEEMEELKRFNHQLEEQNHELRHRIEELTADHEDRAATLDINDSLEQFKRFLGLKLKEDFADYTAISRESLNEVVRRHAHEILGRIFAVLQGEGVRFDRDE